MIDARRQALREILELLAEEGWDKSPGDGQSSTSSATRPIFKRPSLLKFLVVIALVGNITALAAKHDFRAQVLKEREAVLSLVSMDCSVVNGQESNNLEATINVDGKQVWKGPVVDRKSVDLRSVPPLRFDTKCNLELWLSRPGEDWKEFAGLSSISFDHESNYFNTLKFVSQSGSRCGQVSIELSFRIKR
jgi:hypothetical protein